MNYLRKGMNPRTLHMLLMLKAATILQKSLNDRKALGINDDAVDNEAEEAAIAIDEEEFLGLFKRHLLRLFWIGVNCL